MDEMPTIRLHQAPSEIYIQKEAGQSVIILDGLPYLELKHTTDAGMTVLVPLSERPRGQDRTEPPHTVQALPETYRLQTSDESVTRFMELTSRICLVSRNSGLHARER